MRYSKQHKTAPDGAANFRLPLPTLQKLDTYCSAVDITRSQLLRRLIANYEPLKEIRGEQQAGQNSAFSYPGWLVSDKA